MDFPGPAAIKTEQAFIGAYSEKAFPAFGHANRPLGEPGVLAKNIFNNELALCRQSGGREKQRQAGRQKLPA